MMHIETRREECKLGLVRKIRVKTKISAVFSKGKGIPQHVNITGFINGSWFTPKARLNFFLNWKLGTLNN